jgi:hypothetical protein
MEDGTTTMMLMRQNHLHPSPHIGTVIYHRPVSHSFIHSFFFFGEGCEKWKHFIVCGKWDKYLSEHIWTGRGVEDWI